MRRIYADLSTSNVPPEVVHYFAHVGVPATFYVDLIGCFMEYSFDFLTADPPLCQRRVRQRCSRNLCTDGGDRT
jgi:hypothetical protein